MPNRFTYLHFFLTAGIIASSAAAQSLDGAAVRGSFLHLDSMPEALFLIGPIKDGDFFELRRAMREYDVQLIVASSPGGNVYEALQVATAIHDNDIATYVPPEGNCASACAFVFFAGTKRLAAGQLGVHQFYAPNATNGDQVDLNTSLRSAQYTTSEIIGFLNEFQTPPFVYERMFSTEGMHYFDAKDAAALALKGEDPNFVGLRAKAAPIFAEIAKELAASAPEPDPMPSAPEVGSLPPPVPQISFETHSGADLFGGDILQSGVRGVTVSECESFCRASDACLGYSYVISKSWCWPKGAIGALSPKTGVVSGIKRVGSFGVGLETQAAAILVSINQAWSLPNAIALPRIPDYYAPMVDFYGHTLSVDQVMSEKLVFAQRWPIRHYLVEPDSVQITCVPNSCSVDSIISWAAEAPDCGARSSGRSTWNLVLMSAGSDLLIISEGGRVIDGN